MSMTLGEQIKEQVLQLKNALDTANPGMSTMLRTIHNALRNDPDTVTILTPEERGIIVAGLMKQTNTVIATAAVKKSTKSLQKITLDDL